MRNGTGVESEPEDVPAEQAMDFEQDALHANNPQYCVDYVHEIFEHLIASENKLLPSSAYMETVLRPAPLPRHHQASLAHVHMACSSSHHQRGVAVPSFLVLMVLLHAPK
jgi:hypothetical protein